ncbi:hypothetical protein [Accumulibacter sp.]|uniref:hypothetical protein n=1 Tax=Accumulibacter sp. TaxID=2053492 RepID=UPI001A601DB9|nr:hypothetical protein [Accumulibacter sp.]MBL8375343.1 hypothetical protein [Accumulibacter sp.]
MRPQSESTGEVALAFDRLIAGSERAKWVYFSPMGVASARQMLQSGRHSTAFAGRKLFDAPMLVNCPLGQLL